MVALGAWFSALFAGFLGLIAVAPKHHAAAPEVSQTAMYTVAGLPVDAAACMEQRAEFVLAGLTTQTRPTYGTEGIFVTLTDGPTGDVVATAMLTKAGESHSYAHFTTDPPGAEERLQAVGTLAKACQ
jgi:hypothetical protein